MYGTITAAVIALSAMLPGPPHVQHRADLYYADHTIRDGQADYPVADQARRWSRNPYTRLTAVPDCADLYPCIDITEAPDVPDWPTLDGAYWPPDGGPGRIVLATRGNTYMDSIGQGDQFRASLICHEMGHYILSGSDADHSVPGCMYDTSMPRPTRLGRAAVTWPQLSPLWGHEDGASGLGG